MPEFPILFMKGTNAACADGDPIELPRALREHGRSTTSASWPS